MLILLEEDIEDAYTAKLTWHKNNTVMSKGFTLSDDVLITGDTRLTGDLTATGRTSLGPLTVSQNNVEFGRDLNVAQTIRAGTRVELMSSQNGFRLYADDDVYLYLNDSGTLAVYNRGDITYIT